MRLEEAFTVLPVTNEVVEVAADVFAQLKKRGTAVSENDIYIAATAIAHGLPLLTRDRDYLKIGEVAPALRLYLVD
ncbi:MAG: PIN domain-containing protein [Pyrobaculum sp.]